MSDNSIKSNDSKKSSFVQRLISGIVLVAILLVIIIVGGPTLLVSMGIISIIGMWELYKVFNVHNKLAGIFGYIFCALYYANLQFGFLRETYLLFVIFLIVELAIFVFSYPNYKTEQIMAVFFGLFYVAVMISFIYQTRCLPNNGAFVVWLIFCCSWGADTCAYCVGMLFGKHKMSPKLSPKKSVEGAIGGIVGAALIAAIYLIIVRNYMNIVWLDIVILSAIVAVGAFISIIGDLAASAIKRFYDIKDYGKLIPGHGGILDRFDSVIITAPIIYLLSFYFV